MPCKMKLTLENALILPSSITKKYYFDKDIYEEEEDENVTILTLLKGPLCIVAITVKRSTVLKCCPYNIFSIDNMMLSHLEKGRELSCTGTLSHIHSNIVTMLQHNYTLFSIYVEDNDFISFPDQYNFLDNYTKQLMKDFTHSIQMTRSNMENKYHDVFKWQKRFLEEEEEEDNDASTEDNSDDSDFQPVINIIKKENQVRRVPVVIPFIEESQEVYELEDDDSEEEHAHQSHNNNTCPINHHDKITTDDDDDDFQSPIPMKFQYKLSNKKEIKPKRKPSGTQQNSSCRKRTYRRNKSDNDDYRLHRKKSELLNSSGTRSSTRSSGKKGVFS